MNQSLSTDRMEVWGGEGVGGVWIIFNDMVFRGERKTENGGGISRRQQSVKGGTILK